MDHKEQKLSEEDLESYKALSFAIEKIKGIKLDLTNKIDYEKSIDIVKELMEDVISREKLLMALEDYDNLNEKK